MSTEKTLGELVTTNPTAAKVLQRYGLDFCCGGKQSLAQACTAKRLNLKEVLKEIEAAKTAEREVVRWDQRPIEQLIQHILERYHAPLRTDIARLVELAERVEQVHADKPKHPAGLAALLVGMRDEIESHLNKEEQILFPVIRSGHGQTAYMPVQVMIQEHEDVGQNLRSIRALTSDLRPPEHACASWRELYRALAALEVELMDHIHLENNILFPRALAA